MFFIKPKPKIDTSKIVVGQFNDDSVLEFERKHWRPLIFSLIAILLSISIIIPLVLIKAADRPYAAIDVEKGTRSGTVAELNDNKAAGARAIIFNAPPVPPTPAPTPTGSGSIPGMGLCESGDDMAYKGDILPYLKSDSDITVPPGRYSIGPLSEAGKAYKVNVARINWVKVKAAVPGTVVVDGSPNQAAILLGGGPSLVSQKLIIAGIHFTGTSLRFDSTRDVSLWYTCHEYTPKQWHQNVMATAKRLKITIPDKGPKDPHGDGGGLYALDSSGSQLKAIADGMGSFLPTGIRGDASYGASRNLRFFGVDIGPVTDDGIYAAGT